MNRLKRVLLIVFGVFLTIGILYGLYKSPLFRVQTIEFNSRYELDMDTIFVHTGLDYGAFYFEVDPKRIELGLLSHPFVKNVEVKKFFPNKVVLDIEYREHFVTLSYLDVLISIDEEMVVLGVLPKPDDGYYIVGLPFETYSAGRTVDIVKLYALQNMINYIKLFELAKIVPDKEIVFSDNSIFFTVEGIRVNFGLGENWDKRFNDFVVIYNDLHEKGVCEGVIKINSDGAPVYQPFGE